MTTQSLFFALAVAAIITQVPHIYFTINSFSKLQGWLKTVQAVAFCSILSTAIMGFVWIGRSDLALLGAFIEIVFNLYYYSLDFWRNGFPVRNHRDGQQLKNAKRISVGRFWRQNWIAIFMGILIPAMIYIFAEIIVALG